MGTINKDLSLPPYNASNWNSPLNENFTVIDSCLGDTQNISLVGSDYLMLMTDLQNMRINFTGNIGGGDVNVVFPDNVGGSWIISNNARSTGGSILVRTANYTTSPIKLSAAGSEYIFSDGRNVYSAVGGTSGNYLPLTGGTITGDLKIEKTLEVTKESKFVGATTFTGNASFQNVAINGTVNLLATTIGVGKFTVGNYQISGDEVFGVTGKSTFNGDVRVSQGNITLPLGGITVENAGAVNRISGATTIPQGGSLTIKANASFTVETGANLSLAGTFSPSSISTAAISSSDGITVTGSRGVDAGSGGVKAGGTSTFSRGEFSGDVAITGAASVNGKLTNSQASLTDPYIEPSSNTSNIHFNQPSGFNEGMVSNRSNQIGFYKDNDTGTGAYLDLVTGKFRAIGGLSISLNSIGASDIAAHLPSTVISGESDPCGDGGTIDINLVLVALVNKVVELEGQLSVLKGGNRS